MKPSDLSKVVGAGVLSLSLAMMPLTQPASAQTNTGSGSDNTTTVDSTSRGGTSGATDNRNDGFDWGWLGLLGLIGLAGLARKREEPARYREPDEASRTTTRY